MPSLTRVNHLLEDKVNFTVLFCSFLLGIDTTWKQLMDLAFLAAFYVEHDCLFRVFYFFKKYDIILTSQGPNI
jgi:hypothetical protein